MCPTFAQFLRQVTVLLSSVGGSNSPYTDLPTATQIKDEEAFQSCLSNTLALLVETIGFYTFSGDARGIHLKCKDFL
ncbi:hypothetical protein MHYP_G00246650 [Metynnis hypsauchen]